METSRPENARAEIAAHLKGVVVQELSKAMVVCKKGNDPVYPGQDQPLSIHIDRLLLAFEQNDMATIEQYRRGAGSWFPYHNMVERYMEELERE